VNDDPVTDIVKRAAPAVTVLGLIEDRMGTGLPTCRSIDELAPPPGAGLTTLIARVPSEVVRDAGTVASSTVDETTVVGTAIRFTSTLDVEVKLDPVTCSATRVSMGADVGAIEETVGAKLVTVNIAGPLVPPPGGGVETDTTKCPPVSISEAGITAVSFDCDANVVASDVLFHRIVEAETNPEPLTVIVVGGDPAVAELGVAEDKVGAGYDVAF